MKLSSTLLQAITLGIAVSSTSSSCRQNAVNSGRAREKGVNIPTSSASGEKKDSTEAPVYTIKKRKKGQYSCPACGMG